MGIRKKHGRSDARRCARCDVHVLEHGHWQANQMNARGAGTCQCKSEEENDVRSTDTDIFRRINSKPGRRKKTKSSVTGREDTKIRMDGTDMRKREKPPDVK